MEERYLTVSALTKYIKYKFDHDHNLEEVLLEGEISNFKNNSRGHFYFTLKDESASIQAMMFSSFAKGVLFVPSDGMKVFVKGNVSVYEASGTYQIIVKEMKSSGVGDLYLAFLKLKEELEKAGFFALEHKKKLPRFPKNIGVVTSPTGAVIRDIINTVKRRYPLTQITLYPTIVQGADAKADIVKNIKLANSQNICDCLIVGRGGGSIEDLWAFNEKEVAYAIYESHIPIISAVGHEVDFTIADFVADMRAATPTAAAELATPSVVTLKENVNYCLQMLDKRIKSFINDCRLNILNLDKRLDTLNPLKILKHKEDILKVEVRQINLLMLNYLDKKQQQTKLLEEKLKALNPLALMAKGYAITKVNDHIITKVSNVKVGDEIVTEFVDGKVKSKVVEVEENAK